jgi:hypothetical protein
LADVLLFATSHHEPSIEMNNSTHSAPRIYWRSAFPDRPDIRKRKRGPNDSISMNAKTLDLGTTQGPSLSARIAASKADSQCW